MHPTAKHIARFWLPIATVSEANSHAHWRGRQKRAKRQRHTALMIARAHLASIKRLGLPLAIVLERRSTGSLDSDNLAGSTKHIRDGITDALQAVLTSGPRDDSDRLTWHTCQRKPTRKSKDAGGAGVMVTVFARGAAFEALQREFAAECDGALGEWLRLHLDAVDTLLPSMIGGAL